MERPALLGVSGSDFPSASPLLENANTATAGGFVSGTFLLVFLRKLYLSCLLNSQS